MAARDGRQSIVACKKCEFGLYRNEKKMKNCKRQNPHIARNNTNSVHKTQLETKQMKQLDIFVMNQNKKLHYLSPAGKGKNTKRRQIRIIVTARSGLPRPRRAHGAATTSQRRALLLLRRQRTMAVPRMPRLMTMVALTTRKKRTAQPWRRRPLWPRPVWPV